MNWYIKVLKDYVNFDGRARRSEYWYFMLFHLIAIAIMIGLDNLLGLTVSGLPYGAFYFIYALGTFLPGLGVAVRRLHDTGKSGWFILLGFIPIVNLVILVFLVQDSQPGSNAYGPNPKELASQPV